MLLHVFRVKVICSILLGLTFFSIFAFTYSIRYLDTMVKIRQATHDDNLLWASKQRVDSRNDDMRLKSRLNRAKHINLNYLERSKNCRWICKPAINYHEEGHQAKLSDVELKQKVMIIHCLRCLKNKGIMERVIHHRRRKRDVNSRETEKYVPNNERLNSSVISPYEETLHEIFGGWISTLIDKIGGRARKHLLKQNDQPLQREFRKRAILQKSSSSKAKKKLLKVTKAPIVINDYEEEEEYVNNYGDKALQENMAMDLEKMDKKSQDAITYFLLGAMAFFALLFMCVFPVFSFLIMFFKSFKVNMNICCDVCCCKDPKYKLVKKMCEEKNIFIPKYTIYKKLMKKYKGFGDKKLEPQPLQNEATSKENNGND